MNFNSLRYYLNQLVIPSVLVLLGLHSRTKYSLVVLDIKKCHFVKLLMFAKLAYSTNIRRKLETEIRSVTKAYCPKKLSSAKNYSKKDQRLLSKISGYTCCYHYCYQCTKIQISDQKRSTLATIK